MHKAYIVRVKAIRQTGRQTARQSDRQTVTRGLSLGYTYRQVVTRGWELDKIDRQDG